VGHYITVSVALGAETKRFVELVVNSP